MSFLVVNILESFLGEHRKHIEETGQVSYDCKACSEEKGLLDGDGKGNLEVNYNLGVFRCWSCSDTNDMRGSITKLIKRYGTPKTLRDYLLVKPDTDLVNKKEGIDIVVELPEGYKLLSETTDKDYKSSEAKQYLYRRGIGDEIIKDFNIGYTCRGDFFNRIIIPSYDKDLKLSYFIARWFSNQKTKLKYLNPTAALL